MVKIVKNKHYRAFLDNGIIETLSEDQIKQALDNVKGIHGKHEKEGRALIIILYYSGARPNEILNLKGKAVTREGTYIKVRIPGSKRGLPRTLYFRYKQPLIKEFYNYAASIMEEMYIFWHYRSTYSRTVKTRKGPIEKLQVTNTLRYWFNIWFDGILPDGVNPYYLRHNRMSKLAESGASMQELRMLKGAKTYDSVIPYLHMSAKTAKQLSRKIN